MSSADLEAEGECLAETMREEDQDAFADADVVVVPMPPAAITTKGDMDEDAAAVYISYRMRKQKKPRTLRQWRLEGKGPPYRAFGNDVWYVDHEIDRWMATECRVDPAAA